MLLRRHIFYALHVLNVQCMKVYVYTHYIQCKDISRLSLKSALEFDNFLENYQQNSCWNVGYFFTNPIVPIVDIVIYLNVLQYYVQ